MNRSWQIYSSCSSYYRRVRGLVLGQGPVRTTFFGTISKQLYDCSTLSTLATRRPSRPLRRIRLCWGDLIVAYCFIAVKCAFIILAQASPHVIDLNSLVKTCFLFFPFKRDAQHRCINFVFLRQCALIIWISFDAMPVWCFYWYPTLFVPLFVSLLKFFFQQEFVNLKSGLFSIIRE